MIYLDTSAAAKVLIRETGTRDVRGLFATGTELISSRLMAVELHAIADRRGLDPAAVGELIERVALVALTDDIAESAIDLHSGLRTLDALHLATVLRLGDIVTGFVCFDLDLTRAAADRGVPVLSLGSKKVRPPRSEGGS